MNIESNITRIVDAVHTGARAVTNLAASIDRYCDIIEREPPGDSVTAQSAPEPDTPVPEVASQAVPVEADETDATEAAPVEADVTYDYDEHVKPAVLDAVKAHGKDAVLGKMQDMFGCQKAPDIPAAAYGEWLDALKELDSEEA